MCSLFWVFCSRGVLRLGHPDGGQVIDRKRACVVEGARICHRTQRLDSWLARALAGRGWLRHDSGDLAESGRGCRRRRETGPRRHRCSAAAKSGKDDRICQGSTCWPDTAALWEIYARYALLNLCGAPARRAQRPSDTIYAQRIAVSAQRVDAEVTPWPGLRQARALKAASAGLRRPRLPRRPPMSCPAHQPSRSLAPFPVLLPNNRSSVRWESSCVSHALPESERSPTFPACVHPL